MNSKILITLGIIVLVLVVGSALLLNKNNKNTTTSNSTVTLVENTSNSKETETKTQSMAVTVTSSGFEPKDLKIKAGDRVVWTNQSGATATVNSDAHPTHLLWPFLNLGSFDDGQSVSVVFEKAGKYKYHNHFNPSQTGSVTVE